MKDRFRFRVWNIEKKDYKKATLDDTDLLFGKYFCCAEIYDEKSFVIEQCTGLKDKNGTLIYEGDIVRYNLFDKKRADPILKVSYTELLMRFDLISQDGKYQSTYLEPCFNAKLEVIGNIHERKKSKEPCGNYSKCNNAEGCDNCAEYDTWLKESEVKK